MTELTLYWNLGSQPGRAVKTLIDIAKIPCTFINVDIFQRQQRTKPYLEMYPAGKIPVLKEKDFVLGESGAIMIYLCQRYPHVANYHGSSIQQKAVVNQYVAWYQNYFRPALFKPIKMYLGSVLMNQPIYENHRNALFKDTFDAVQKLNQILLQNKTKFIAGDNPTIADFLLYYQLTNLMLFGLGHDSYAEVKRWFIEVYRISQVKVITHEWHQLAKMLIELFSNVQICKSKL